MKKGILILGIIATTLVSCQKKYVCHTQVITTGEGYEDLIEVETTFEGSREEMKQYEANGTSYTDHGEFQIEAITKCK